MVLTKMVIGPGGPNSNGRARGSVTNVDKWSHEDSTVLLDERMGYGYKKTYIN